MKSLQVPNWYLQTFFVWKTDNTMTKIKWQKNKKCSTQHRKLKLEHHESLLKIRGELRCSGMINISCFTSGVRRVTLLKKKRWYARDGCEALGFHSCAFYFIFNTWVHEKMDLFAFPIIHFSSLHIRRTNMKSLPKIIYITSILYPRYSDNEQTQNSTNQIYYIQR
jgi:hypothetical protein